MCADRVQIGALRRQDPRGVTMAQATRHRRNVAVHRRLREPVDKTQRSSRPEDAAGGEMIRCRCGRFERQPRERCGMTELSTIPENGDRPSEFVPRVDTAVVQQHRGAAVVSQDQDLAAMTRVDWNPA
jgi:hypothetical protein